MFETLVRLLFLSQTTGNRFANAAAGALASVCKGHQQNQESVDKVYLGMVQSMKTSGDKGLPMMTAGQMHALEHTFGRQGFGSKVAATSVTAAAGALEGLGAALRDNEAIQGFVGAMEGIPKTLVALLQHQNSNLAANAVWALYYVCKGNHENQDTVGEVEGVVEALSLLPHRAHIRLMPCWTIQFARRTLLSLPPVSPGSCATSGHPHMDQGAATP